LRDNLHRFWPQGVRCPRLKSQHGGTTESRQTWMLAVEPAAARDVLAALTAAGYIEQDPSKP
jgi:hypothetical protein